jgi:hypothetical protein
MQPAYKYRFFFMFSALLIALVTILSLNLVWDAKHIRGWNIKTLSVNTLAPGMVIGITNNNFTANANDQRYFRDMVFVGDTAQLKNIRVNLGNRSLIIQKEQLTAFDATGITIVPGTLPLDNSRKMYTLKSHLPVKNSLLPFFNRFVNWGGDDALVLKIILHPLLLFYFLTVLLFWFIKKKANRNTLPQAVSGKIHPANNLFHIAAAGVFFLLFFILIFASPYYFLQDDNYAQFTPVIINGLDGWYNQGNFPSYNSYQLAGVPTFGYSTYSLLYPGTHISYLFSRYILNDVYQFNNVFALIHFAIGYLFCYRLLLRLKLHPVIAIAAAASFVFCGFNLVAVRSWYYVAPTVCFLPAIFYVIISKPISGLFSKKYLWLVVLFTLYAYSGNFQYWIYTFLFFSLFEIMNYKKAGVLGKGLLSIALVFIISIALFSPQLITTAYETSNLPRTGGAGQGIIPGAGALLFPYLGSGELPNGWGRSDLHSVDVYFYYGAFILLPLAFAAIIYKLLYRRYPLFSNNDNKVFHWLCILLGIAFVFSMGRSGLLWWLLAKFPLFNKFNHPFKFLLFVQFFGIITGAILIQQLFRRFRFLPANFWIYSFSIVTVVLLGINMRHTRQAFYVYTYQKPYPAISWLNQLEKKIDYRVFPLGPSRSPDRLFESSLQMNFPTVYKIPSLDGYEPLNDKGTEVYRYHREFGVRYFIQSKHKAESNIFSGENNTHNFSNYQSFTKKYEDAQVIVYEDSLYEPVIQLFDAAGKRWNDYNIEYRSNGIDIIMKQKTTFQKIKLNILYREGLKIMFDDMPCIKFNKDSLGAVWCSEMHTASAIRIRYRALPSF